MVVFVCSTTSIMYKYHVLLSVLISVNKTIFRHFSTLVNCHQSVLFAKNACKYCSGQILWNFE